MRNLSLSEKYSLVAAILLLLVVFIDNAVVMLIVSVIGLSAGAFVVRAGEAKRAAFVAALAFAVLLGFGVYALLR